MLASLVWAAMHPLARLTVLLMPTLARLTVLMPTLARPTMLMPTLARLTVPKPARLTMPGAHASEANAAAHAHAHARKPNMPKLAMPTCSCKQA